MRNTSATISVRSAACLLIAVISSVTGCLRCPDCNGVHTNSPCAVASPPGTYTREHLGLEHARARQNRFSIYQHEWYSGGDKLGPQGREHVQAIAGALVDCPGPIVVERQDVMPTEGETIDQAVARTGHLDETRRQAVVQALAEAGIPDADGLVIVARPTSEHLIDGDSINAFQRFRNPGLNYNLGSGSGQMMGQGMGGGFGGGGGGGMFQGGGLF